MTEVLVTGGRGFLGRNLITRLRERGDCKITIFEREDSDENLRSALATAQIIFHLAGVNRPTDPQDFNTVNFGLTRRICCILTEIKRTPKIVFSSSVQAELDNEYGASKRQSELILRQYGSESGAIIRVYRLKNLFGKWCRPNYNSVTATFCYNIAHDLPISIHDVEKSIELSYVDDVVKAFLTELEDGQNAIVEPVIIPSYRISLGELAGRIQAFHDMRKSLTLEDFADWFNRALYATYLSYVPAEQREYALPVRCDERGSLAEFIKQSHFGQIFISRTKPGVTRGNHYHHTKTEKFLVVEGDGLIRMRAVEGGPIDEYYVKGNAYQVVNIPPGLTHSIKNIGNSEMVTIFWASEVFDPGNPDTYYLPVDIEEPKLSLQSETA